MAYVAISNSLIDAVKDQIRTQHKKEVGLIPKPTNQFTVPGNNPTYLQAVWKQHLPLMAQMPKEWMGEVDNASLRTTSTVTGEDGVERTVRSGVSLSFRPYLRIPPKQSAYGLTIDTTPDDPMIKDTVAYDHTIAEITARWNKVEHDIVWFLQECKSLNEALKLWPDIRIYVPSHYLAKAEEKTAKAKAAESRAMEILKEIDVDHAVSSAVMVRMLEASKTADA